MIQIDNDTIVMVKTRYFPSNGTTKDVGGIMSSKSIKNKVSASKIEIHNVIFSPEFVDNMNTKTVKNDMLTHGIITFII